MEKDKEHKQRRGVSVPRTFASDLRGRQSVRATFKLTEGCIDAISIVAAHLGIKQKSLFDHLVEDTSSLSSIAREIQHVKLANQARIQKTFVISRRSLSSLEKISQNCDAPRDALVEYFVKRLLPIIANEREKHNKRKDMLGEIENHFKKGNKLLKKMRSLLGVDDPIYQKLEPVMMVYEKAFNDIDFFIEKGKIIEDFHLDTM